LQAHLTLENLVEGCINSNRESQRRFYLYLHDFCFRTCITYCKNNDDCHEVVNDGFLKIFLGLKSFRASYENFEISLKSWIKRIMINTAIDKYRKNQKNNLLDEINDNVLDPAAIEESAIDKLSYNEIIKVVQRLSPAYRSVFSLYVIYGFKHEDIARELKISIGTSKSNLLKARMNIQKMIPSGFRQNTHHSSKRDTCVLVEI
jgi:RNA polymerase sigma-70 factor (ECF subfamily)